MEAFIVDIKKTQTRHHNGMIYEITFMDFSKRVYTSYVDPTNRNYKNWQTIISNHFHENSGFILSNLRQRSQFSDQIDADSKPRVKTETVDRQAMLDIINEKIQYDPRKAIFTSLFELD